MIAFVKFDFDRAHFSSADVRSLTQWDVLVQSQPRLRRWGCPVVDLAPPTGLFPTQTPCPLSPSLQTVQQAPQPPLRLATSPTYVFQPLGTQRHLLQISELPHEVLSMGHQAGPPLCPALPAPVWVQPAKLAMMTDKEGLVLRLGTPPGNHSRRRKDATFWGYRVTNCNFVLRW